jgi:hypothetical protein
MQGFADQTELLFLFCLGCLVKMLIWLVVLIVTLHRAFVYTCFVANMSFSLFTNRSISF